MDGRGDHTPEAPCTPEAFCTPEALCPVAEFRASFPEYADPALWPDAVIERVQRMALCYLPPGRGKRLSGAARALALDLMAAHLLFLEDAITRGKGGKAAGLVSGATVDKVSVSLTPPPVKNQFAWWLSLSPRGAELLALLRSRAAGGLYVGGTPPERAAFRKAGGVFINGRGNS